MASIRASMDMGSNSFILTIAEIEDKQVKRVLVDELAIVRLGQDVDATKRLHPEAIERATDALEHFRQICKRHDVATAEVRIGATSAMRDAEDRQDFIDRVRNTTGFQIEVIPGEEEGRVSWRGALSSLSLPEDASPCLLDIGGGSTELIWNKAKDSVSLDVGVVRARERYLQHDPPRLADLDRLHHDLKEQLEALDLPNAPIPLIAVAGTATTFAAIQGEVEPYDPERIHGSTLSIEALAQMRARFCRLTNEERKAIPGLMPQRADLITGGAQIMMTVAQHLNVTEMLISDRGLRFGLLLDD